MRPTIAEIDLDALSHNYNQLKGIVGKDVSVAPVIKADAYGHGAVRVSTRLEKEGTDMFIVAFVEEGIELREAGIKTPILIAGAFLPEDSGQIIKWNLTPMVFTICQIDALDSSAKRFDRRIKVHIKVDTGMGRLGLVPEDLAGFAGEITKRKNMAIEGIMTHFAQADIEDNEFAIRQLNVFNGVLEELRRNGYNPPVIHSANSAAIICLKESHFNMVRPGLMLYGVFPIDKTWDIGLKPVMSLRSKVVQVKRIPEGCSIGYGKSFITRRETQIATVPIAYAVSYSRRLSNSGNVIIRGKKAPVVGNVCMDMTMVDVTDHRGVCVGDEVILMGRQGDELIAAEDLARLTGTIPYEVLSCIGKRVPRVYRG
ncbi:MAG: alanine racemase [Nitrospirota bacterium]